MRATDIVITTIYGTENQCFCTLGTLISAFFLLEYNQKLVQVLCSLKKHYVDILNYIFASLM